VKRLHLRLHTILASALANERSVRRKLRSIRLTLETTRAPIRAVRSFGGALDAALQLHGRIPACPPPG